MLSNTSTYRKGFQIGPPDDGESFLKLFALVLDETKRDPSPFCVQQGTLLQWIHNPELRPTIEDLKANLRDFRRGGHSPAWIVDPAMWEALPVDRFLRALELTVEAAPYFEVSSDLEIYRILAAVAQTVGSADQAFKDANNKLYRARIEQARHAYKTAREKRSGVQAYVAIQRLAESPTAAPSQGISRTQGVADRISDSTLPPPTIQRRVSKPEKWPSLPAQDSFGSLSNNRIDLWHASSIGPLYAQKDENQDVTFALSDGPRVFFALADGVSTSYGSRFSAAAIVRSFCANLQESISAGANSRPNSLTEAATATQAWLDRVLSFLLAYPEAPEWSDVRGRSNIASDVAIRLCENTVKRERLWGPVLATTLVGGVVEPSADGKRLEVAALRIGDGLIEHIASLGEPNAISSILEMDRQVTEISASLCPGPLGQKAVVSPEIVQASIEPGGALVISSDGLARGHSLSVSQKLRDIVGVLDIGLRRKDQICALNILQTVARHADDVFAGEHEQELFNDNLSIIALAYDLPIAKENR